MTSGERVDNTTRALNVHPLQLPPSPRSQLSPTPYSAPFTHLLLPKSLGADKTATSRNSLRTCSRGLSSDGIFTHLFSSVTHMLDLLAKIALLGAVVNSDLVIDDSHK
ncbi:hypothetical protein J6590_060055 [Homalodisca vitripennis]|nr:hypothetical protein J6590_060055 [Homalodisca vitripennis]